MNDILIRKATKLDIESCNSVDSLMGFSTKAIVFDKAADEGRLLVAISDSLVYGYLRYGYVWDYEVVYIQMIRVVEGNRGNGVGRKLVELLENELRNLKVTQLTSSTDESNEGSYRFHQALGFQECGYLDINNDGLKEVFFKKIID